MRSLNPYICYALILLSASRLYSQTGTGEVQAEYTVQPVGSVNTKHEEFCPFIVGQTLIYTAARPSFDLTNESFNETNGTFFTDLYTAIIDQNKLTSSKPLSQKINTPFYDGPACVSADGKTLYFAHVDNGGKKDQVKTSGLYTAMNDHGNWKNSTPLTELNNSTYSITHPCISKDQNTLYFCSDMPGGYGGKDLYRSVKTNGSWEKPVNLGPGINTAGDEMFPSLHHDSILFFASNGHPGIGGLDIFTARQSNGRWLMIRNEGKELNSIANDYGLTFLNDSVGYFSSNREGGKGKDDIYRFTFQSKKHKPANTEPKQEEKVADLTPATIEAPVKTDQPAVPSPQIIYYAYGQFAVTSETESLLNTLVAYLKTNQYARLEINAYTDSQSSSGFNMQLSQKRANAIAAYLIKQGIAKSRIKTNSYGETRIINKCTDNVNCGDEQHQENRRAELKLIL